MADSKFTAINVADLKTYTDLGFGEDVLKQLNEKAQAILDKTVQRYTIGTNAAPDDKTKELRLVLLGKTGAGKSATGNLVIGDTQFKESHKSESCTDINKEGKTTVDGVAITLVDTPGLCDTSKNDAQILTEIAKIFDKFSNGIHGFLFVMGLGNPRFTKEELDAFNTINESFGGKGFFEHCFMVLTHGDSIGENQTLADKLKDEEGHPLGDLMQKLREKVIIVDNRMSAPIYLRNELQKRVVNLVATNVKIPFTDDTIDLFSKNKETTKNELVEKDRPHASEIESAVAAKLEEMERDTIKELDHGKITPISREIKKELSDKSIHVERRSIVIVILAQQKRLTDDSYLGMIMASWSAFLAMFKRE